MQNLISLFNKQKKQILRVAALVLPVVCLMSLLSQTVFAQTTYVITDGNQTTVHTTYTTNPAKALGEAGLALGEDDSYTTQETQEDSTVEITIQRAQTITVRNCGEVQQINSYGETLAALLDRLGIATSGEYVVSLPLETQTYDGMEVSVDRLVEQVETYTVEIPYDVSYCYDPTMPAGETKILIPGVAGEMVCTDTVVYCNTQEQSRTNLIQTVLEQPVEQVVLQGTGARVGQVNDQPIFGDGVIVLPTGEVLTYTKTEQFVATAYTKTDDGCDETTATGSQVHPGVVAVDPTVIPYGTRMFIVTNDGAYIYGLSTAEDCGGAIIGNRLDLYFETEAECWKFGIRDCTVYFLGDANWR